MVKRRPGVSILPLMLIVILCVSWLTQLNQRDEMTYDEMVQLFEQQKVEAFRFTDSSTLMLQVKGRASGPAGERHRGGGAGAAYPGKFRAGPI